MTPSPAPDTRSRPLPSPRILKATLLATAMLTLLAGAAVAPALPLIEAHFAAEGETELTLIVGLILTLPALFVGLTAPFLGWVVDRFGRRPVLLVAGGIYLAAGTAGLWLDSLTGLLVSRALLGLAIGGLMTANTTLIGDYFTGNAREAYMGLQAAGISIGGITFIALGGVLADLDWRAPFILYGAAVLLVPVWLFVLPEPARPGRRAAGEPERPPEPWDRRKLFGFMAFFIPFSLVSVALIFLVPLKIPFLLREIGVERAALFGVAIGTSALMSAIVALNFGRLRRRFSAPAMFAMAFALIAAGFLAVSRADSLVTVMAAMLLHGTGMGGVIPTLTTWLIREAPEAVRGRCVGLFNSAIFIGQFVTPFLAAPITVAVGTSATFAVFGGLIGLMSAGFAFALVWRRVRAGSPPSQRGEGA